MRRRRDTRPTVIYWLTDTRTGVPFYCGKTVLLPERRLLAHRYDAKNGTTRVNVRVRECGEHIRVDTMEVVPTGADWGAREKWWISTLRIINPNCCNTVDGGAGVPGRIPSEETREKMSAWQRGRKLTSEHREKIRQIMLGKTWPTERIERMRANKRGISPSPEARAKISAANRGRPSKYKGVPRTDEVKAKISAATTGKLKRVRRVVPPCPVPLP
jgi:hypothetical protein